jgi:hypothetical protein
MYVTGRTGKVRVLLNFMNELVKSGHEISLTTMYYDNCFPLSKDIKIISKWTKYNEYLSFLKFGPLRAFFSKTTKISI